MKKLPRKRVILIILDGWGYSEDTRFNAIHSAKKPSWDTLWARYPHTLISASGTDVGLPEGQMGNSEVGHMNIGSGRVIEQDFTRITHAIEGGSFYKNKVLCASLERLAATGKAVHILGLLSDGGVHSHQEHLFALVRMAEKYHIDKIHIHAFLDGRDTPPRSAADYLHQAQLKLDDIGKGRIASIVGRYYAMDRNQNWDRTRMAYDLITRGRAEYRSKAASLAVDMAYARGETDEFVLPTAIIDAHGQPTRVAAGDAIIFGNYRADRARQLTLAFTKIDFSGFPRTPLPAGLNFISLTKYKTDFDFPVVFPMEQYKNVFGEFIAAQGLRQLRIAETEKYAHVTFFFNGGKERVFDNEDRILVSSPHVSTYDKAPEMSAFEVADKMTAAINSQKYDAIISNFANADMLGHTGDFKAAIKAIETLDRCLQQIVEAARQTGAEILITADHGNAEQMCEFVDGKEQAHTAHTRNLVPLIYVGRRAGLVNPAAALCDLSPTMLHLMDLGQPDEMTGRTIFRVTDEC